MNTNKKLIKRANLLLAALLAMIGFAGCNKIGVVEYGSPHADYTVKGAIVNKETQKPIEGIRVGYFPQEWLDVFGTPPEYYYGPKTYVITNVTGEFSLTERCSISSIPVRFFFFYIDGEKNGLFQSESMSINFSKAEHSGKSKGWYNGIYTLTVKAELSEVKNQ
jgi:putative lipoprotein (rSAM/lipoprotein system)